MADDSGKFQRELAEISKAHKKLEGHLAKFEGLSSLIRYQEPVAWMEEVTTIIIVHSDGLLANSAVASSSGIAS